MNETTKIQLHCGVCGKFADECGGFYFLDSSGPGICGACMTWAMRLISAVWR